MAPPIRVLAIDGGGIRGVSALLILERVMEKIRDKAGLSSTPRPCEYFDMIGGTSTGGIIAIMLGRLGMSVDECLREYMALAEQAFTPKRGFRFPKSPSGGYSATQLEEAIKKVVAKKCKEGPEALFRDYTCCKTVVLAITKRDVSGSPTLFKTYDTSDSLKDCTIWQVARATSAATTFFKSIKCGRDDIEFIDAGFGHNNPCETILSEAREIDASCTFSCILSIGTGLGRAADIRDSRLSILKALKDMATSSKRIHDSAYGRYSNTVYFRFDATVGVEGIKMDDWKESSTIAANTNNYLNSERRRIDECSEKLRALKSDGGSGETAGQSSDTTGPSQVPNLVPATTTEIPMNPPRTVPELTDNSSFDVIPFPQNEDMVQRPGLMSQLDKLLPLDDKRHEAAIWGLGGAGKTQIALDYAYRRKGAISCCVFWVHAGTEARFTDDYNKIAERAGLGANLKGRDMLQAVRQWLEKQKNWLLILDNADDIQLFVDGGILRTFLPQASHGSVLWTSRDQEIIWSLVGKTKGVEVGKMLSEESLTLLLPNGIEVTEDQDLKLEQEAANMLVGPKGLDGLPLAISQAGTYIQKSKISVSGYVRLFQNSESKMLSIESSDSYRSGVPNSVMRTWLISMEKIREDPTAERILRTVAFFDNQGIPFELIQAAATPESSTNADDFSDKDSLDPPESDALTSATLLVRYSFLKHRQDKNKDGFPNYEQHRLIPLATQRALNKTQRRIYSKRAQDIITEVFPFDPDHSTWDLCKKYLPHALKIFSLRESEPMDAQAAELMYNVGAYHYQQGLYQEAERLHSKVVELRKSTAGERDRETITAISHLALDFAIQGNDKKAEPLQVQVLELWKAVLGEKHPDTIRAMNNLAATWNDQGQFNKAEALRVQVLELQKAVLGEKHLDTITAMNNLAMTWNKRDRFDKAEALLVQVLELRKAVLGEKHPDTITAMNNLAATWNEQGQFDKAEALKEQVLELSKAVLGEKHPGTITAMNNLAGTWYGQGHYEKAENTQVEVLKLWAEVLGAHHPDTREAMCNLACTYEALGRDEESRDLLEKEALLTAEWEKENSAYVVNGSYTGWAPNWQVGVEDITSTARAKEVSRVHGWIRPKYRRGTRSVKFRWR